MTRIDELAGVYDADGGLRGEAAYVVGHLLGRAHCALCDITHSPVRRKRSWDEYVSRLEVPFTLAHRNETSGPLESMSRGRLPAVLARVGESWHLVLGAQQLETCGGDVDAFAVTLERALAARGFSATRPAAP